MYWADRFANQIIKSGKYKPYWVDDMKTPSGRVHVGALRGVVIHDLIYKAIKKRGFEVTYTYCINDMDPMDGFPPYLDKKTFYKYMGWPLVKIPSPQEGFKTFSEYYAKEFIQVFNKIGCFPEVVWTSELYKKGRFDKIIRVCLNNTEKIRKIFRSQYEHFKNKEYFPYLPICPQCGKIATTKIFKWDGNFVYFRCEKKAADYTEGCGFKGKVKPEKMNGKLPWKIEWAAHWKVLGVTIEWAGKDHMTKGGSHEISSKVSEQILKYPTPNADLYEHVLVGGRKMSSSKGLGSSAKEISDLLPPALLRFLMVKTHYRKTIDFDPNGNTIPNLFDEYDFCAYKFYEKGKKSDFGRVWQLSQIQPVLETEPFLPRFRDVANYIQLPSVNIYKKFEEIKGGKLTKVEKDILDERIKYAKIWLKTHAPKELVYQVTEQIPEEAKKLSDKQKVYLEGIIQLIEQKDWLPEEFQVQLYKLAKKLKIPSRKAFQAIYLSLIGRPCGPKAAWFLLDQDKNFLIKRLKEVQDICVRRRKKQHLFPAIEKPNLFIIDQRVREKFPSITVGLAIIKGVRIKKEEKKLQQEIASFLQSTKGLTTKEIGEFSEIKSYRKIYKKTGVDWHSRRPSPEALLRRIALAKGLYKVNTCVDAYNLIVMKNRVSAGAFDLDKIKFPTILRFAKKGEKILLIGDKEPTEYKEGEIAYFDKIGGYNIDFNFRDAQRTMVTKKTKNLWINTEGVYDISREQVEQSLKEVIDIITKYCGGKVEFAGTVKAN